jgi:hypothetical protein
MYRQNKPFDIEAELAAIGSQSRDARPESANAAMDRLDAEHATAKFEAAKAKWAARKPDHFKTMSDEDFAKTMRSEFGANEFPLPNPNRKKP